MAARRCLVLAGLLLGLATAAATASPQGDAVRQSFDLEPGRHGVRGTLELILDARVTDTIRSAADSELLARPLRGARLRLLDAAGRVIDEQAFEPAVATLEAVDLQGAARPTYLLRADYGAGIGPYYGLVSFPMEVRNGRLRRLFAVDESGVDRPGEDDKGGGRSEPIVLLSALRSGWVLIRDGEDDTKAILVARSRPHLEDPQVREGFSGDSVILFQTYRYRGGQWHRWERRMIGEWEDGGEDSWPDRRLFP